MFTVKEVAKSNTKRFEKDLANHATLQEVIMQLSLNELEQAMLFEKQNKDRAVILARLYQRFSQLRSNNEKKKLLS